MGHYDSNREFDEEYRENLLLQAEHQPETTVKTMKIRDRFDVIVHRFTPTLFSIMREQGSDIIIDLTASQIEVPNNVYYYSTGNTDISNIVRRVVNNFSSRMDIFYIIADIEVFMILQNQHPNRDLRLLLV